MKGSRCTGWLDRTHPVVFSVWCMAAAFGTYFCMYAFRKPFTAATFTGEEMAGIGFKSVLVMAQVVGYTLSKFVGIRVISEIPPQRRIGGILLLIAFSEMALLLFGLVPTAWKVPCLFLNGLPLGMVFGLVLSFMEGRRMTEALSAGLCASFIVSSGVVKSVGRWLIVAEGISEYWMPFLTGLLFIPPLILSVWMLAQIPPPTANDIAARAERSPMSQADRRRFLRRHGTGLGLLLGVYTLLTIIRSIRDDFGVEIWQGLGFAERPTVFARSETLVMFVVVLLTAAGVLIRDNRRAFQVSLVSVLSGFGLLTLVTVMFQQNMIRPFPFMVLTGITLYVPYVLFHTTIFERLIAATRSVANLGFLMYLADSLGYLGYIGLVFVRNLQQDRLSELDFLGFFLDVSLLIGGIAVLLTLTGLLWFSRTLARLPEHGRPASGT